MEPKKHNTVPQALRHACGKPKPGETLLENSAFDGFERDALYVMRHVFLTMSHGVGERPGDPFYAAEAVFPGVEGAEVASALIAYVQTMAMGRTEHFSFSNPHCPGCARVLTDSERHLLSVLHHTRRGRAGTATAHAVMLCDRAPASALLGAAQDVSERAPGVALVY